jgi:DNA-directed RNA polymerase subunit RPC12/RpoP
MPYADYDEKTMRNKSETVGKCPACGYQGSLSQFLEKSDTEHWGGIVARSTQASCPSCNSKLRFKYKWLTLALLLFVFCALVFVIVLFPKYISHFSYIVGAIFLIYYLLQRFRFIKTEQIFEIEKKT